MTWHKISLGLQGKRMRGPLFDTQLWWRLTAAFSETDLVNISLSMSSNGLSLSRCERNHQWKFGDERHNIQVTNNIRHHAVLRIYQQQRLIQVAKSIYWLQSEIITPSQNAILYNVWLNCLTNDLFHRQRSYSSVDFAAFFPSKMPCVYSSYTAKRRKGDNSDKWWHIWQLKERLFCWLELREKSLASRWRSPGNTLDFDELFIGVRSGPALYCFDVTNDDGMAH